ncbi:2-thiouracil desulfurase family protein [Enterobacter sp. RD4-1-1]|uniref:2-thiouracil desulfurase family protein n=1 Tax=Enterobacter dykesii TaxID=2797506 RepID=A0AAU7IZE8_9ENTR|nr:2-thiouracil desulfurase family protein [Enterobacter dykesii]MCR6469765.1 2-thiouracil desulfurase family protein [Enterobacter sp. HG048]MCV3773002.1 2-thiouracil desulfurase family protein [Enterobacter sp. RD4-1-1]
MPVEEIILLSACLSAHLVRYNGTDKSCSSDLLQNWRKEGRLVTHCPELAAGLSTPPYPQRGLAVRKSIVQAHTCTKPLRQVKTCHQLMIKWYRINYSGLEEEYFNMLPEDVRIVSISPAMTTGDNPNENPMETVELRYEKITWKVHSFFAGDLRSL